MILYPPEDKTIDPGPGYQCIYPAQAISKSNDLRNKKLDLFSKVKNSEKGVILERNEPSIFGGEESTDLYTNYWVGIRNPIDED